MRILVLNRFSSPFYSGAGVAAQRLCNELVNFGHEVKRVSFINMFWFKTVCLGNNHTNYLAPVFSSSNVSERYFGRFYTFLFELYCVYFLLRFLRRIDVVYYASLTRLNFVSIFFAKMCNKKVIVKISGNNDDMLSNVIINIFGFSTFKILKSVDRYIAINKTIFIDLTSTVGGGNVVLSSNVFSHDHKFIDTEFSKRSNKITDVVHYVFSGILSKRKGTDVLISIWRNWVKNKKAVLHLVGPIEKDFNVSFEENEKSLKYHGLQNVDYVYSLYRKADVFILPTSSEGMPNALIEALLFSIPSIVTNIPGITDCFVKSRIVYPIDLNLENLEECINELYSNSELRKILSSAAYNWARQNVNSEKIIKDYFFNL